MVSLPDLEGHLQGLAVNDLVIKKVYIRPIKLQEGEIVPAKNDLDFEEACGDYYFLQWGRVILTPDWCFELLEVHTINLFISFFFMLQSANQLTRACVYPRFDINRWIDPELFSDHQKQFV